MQINNWWKNISTNKKIVLVFVLLVLIIGLLVIVSQRGTNSGNTGGTGGDYTPAGWVVVNGIPSSAGITSIQSVEIANKLTEQYSSKGGEYTARYEENSMKVEYERSVYRSVAFTLKIVQTNDQYLVKVYTDYVTGTTTTTVNKL